METLSINRNSKTNAVLNEIYKLFVEHFDTLDEAVEQINYCIRTYKQEFDYNLAQSAMVFMSTPDQRAMYEKNLKKANHWNEEQLWHRFLYDVGNVAWFIALRNNKIKSWK